MAAERTECRGLAAFCLARQVKFMIRDRGSNFTGAFPERPGCQRSGQRGDHHAGESRGLFCPDRLLTRLASAQDS
jgi:hypothetical protein